MVDKKTTLLGISAPALSKGDEKKEERFLYKIVAYSCMFSVICISFSLKEIHIFLRKNLRSNRKKKNCSILYP